MSTQLFLRLTASDLGGAGQQALSTVRGAASHTAVTNTTASGTNIQVTATAAGQALTWFSPPLAGAVGPIAGSITVNIWGFESSASANSKAGITIEHTDSLGNVLSTIVANTAVPTTSSEYGLTPGAAKNASFTPTSTALNYGDRIKVTLFVKNQGTMGGGFTVTNSYDGPTAAAAGDTYVTFTENLFPAYSGGPQGWSSPAGIRAVYTRTGVAMASPIPSAAPSLAVTTTSLPNGTVGQPYAATLAATGGTPSYTWSISAGSLPAGLSLAPSTGVISGTPTGPPGTTSFTVKVTDSLSNTATKPLSITIVAPPVIPSGPVRIRITPPPRGRTWSNPGGPVRNPVPPPPVHLPHGPVQAKLLPPPRRGRMAADWGVTLFQNPNAGPVFTQRTTPARAHPALPPRGRIASNPGVRVTVPHPAKVYPAQGPVRARVAPPFSKGRISSGRGAPLRNPGSGPVFRQAVHPARAAIPQVFSKGRVSGNPGTPVVVPPPLVIPPFGAQGTVQAKLPLPRRGTCRAIRFLPVQPNPQQGPAFIQAASPARIRPSLPPRGRISGNKGGPVPPPPVVAPFRQLSAPARIRPGLPPRGRVSSSPGAPVRNPHAGPAFRQATTPARIRVTLPPRGRTGANPGGPVVPPPVVTVAPFYPRASARAKLPLPRRGTCRAIRFYPVLIPPPSLGPVFRQAAQPVRAPIPQRVRGGRITSNPGAPLRNPGTGPAPSAGQPAGIRVIFLRTGDVQQTPRYVAPVPPQPVTGPAFRQAASPARMRPSLPPRGRTGSNPGGPVIPPPVVTVAVFRQAAFTRAKLPPSRRGTCRTIRFCPLPPPPQAAPFHPAAQQPARIRPGLPPRGRTGSNPGTPPPPPVPAKVYPAHGPVRTRITLPPRGKTAGNPGAPVRNPHAGPVFRQAVRPARGIIPQNAPRGRTSGNPGGPVENIPFATLRFRTGEPYFQWDTGSPGFQWATGEPGLQWSTGTPEAG